MATNEAPESKFAQLRFQILITLAKRAILIRDDVAGLFTGGRESEVGPASGRRAEILSGTRRLEGLFLLPEQQVQASVLILHGIGERLEYWQKAQRLLAGNGIASLIFDYTGYGKNRGSTNPANLRQDAIAAYAELRRFNPGARAPYLLGLSLGTGVAVDVTPHLRPPPAGVILCEAFTSLRSAAAAVLQTLRLPETLIRWLSKLMPDVYRTADSISLMDSPLLLIHSDADELFPVKMAEKIFAAACQDRARLHIPSGFAHNDAYLNPSLAYWQPILDFVLAETPTEEAKVRVKR